MAKFRTAGIGTKAPKANATVSVIALNAMDGPILATARATLSSGGKDGEGGVTESSSSCAGGSDAWSEF